MQNKEQEENGESKPEEIIKEELKPEELEIVKDDKTSVKVYEPNQIVKLDDFNSANEALEFAKILIASKIIPSAIKTPEAVVATIQQGKEIGLKSMAALNNIVLIDGKSTLSLNAYAALAEAHGIAWQTLKDYAPEYKTDEETGEIIYYEVENGKFKVVNNVAVKTTKEKGGRPKQIDTITTIKFFKKWNGIVLEETVDFRWSDAVTEKLVDKYNWQKMPRRMLWARCFTMGARRVAPKAFMGLYEVSEVADMNNLKIDLDSEGNPIQKDK